MLKFLSNNSVLFLSKVLFAIFISFFFLTGCGNGKEDNVYVVTFLSEGGDVLRKLEVPMGDSLKVPSPLFKQDHTFMGWLELDGTQMIPDGITSYTPVKDMTFKALYAPDNAPAYTVIFIDYDDSVIKTVNVTSGSSMPLPPSPQRRDYTFIGWLEVSQIGMIPDGVPSYTPSRNIVFKAAYIPNNSNDFNVIFIDENDNIIQELNVTKGKSLVVPLPTIPQDYTFMGWQEVNGTKMLAKGVRAYTPTDNIIFKALYVSDSAPTYTLIFLDEDDDIVAARNVTKGQSLNVPTAPNKPNYTFTLWQEMGGSETISSDSYTPTNSSVFKAVYSPLKYTVIFFSDTDQLISTQSVLAGQSVLVPTTPQKEHYRFVHWSEVGGDENLSNTSSSYTPTKDITFKALFTPIIYQVTFLRDDGSVMSSINATSGSSVNVPQALDIQDFTFLGYIEAGGKEMLAKGVATYAPTKDITFKPRYVSNQASIFTVIFLDEDDNIAHEFNVTKGNSLTIPTPFVKIDHTFMGWAEVEGAVTIYDGLFTPTHDTIFKALYIPNDPTIFKALFLDENNHILYEFNVTKGSSFTIPSAPVKSDHIFVSWLEVNGDKSMSPGTYTPTHDIIFKALYLPSSPTYFSVIFIDESHNILKEFNVTKGSSITPPPAPNKPNHTFISWAEVGGTKTITSKPYTPTKDTAFKASYIQNGASTYKILFLDEDDSVIGDMDIPQGSSAPIPSAPVKTGKLFMGWFEIDAASVLISGSFTPAKNSIFKAMYTDESASSYAVIFLDEDNSLLNEFDIAKGQPLSTIPTASPKPNHTFIGWSEVGGSQMIPNGANSYTPTKNIIFKPSYVSSAASAYTLIFLDEDNSVIGEINITKGSSTIIPTAPSKPNRTFKLWLEVNGSESLTTGSYTPTKNTIFKALYLPNSQTSYTLILLDDNNNFLNEFNITKGNSVAIPEAPVKPNYTFMAWLELNGSESLFGNSYTPTKDIIFRAFYTQGNPSSYKIYFLDEDNRILEELSIPKGQHLNIPTPTPKPNHTFMGWVELNGEDILDDGSYIPTKDTIFKVLYLPDDPSSFTVLFFGDNNIIISNITIDVGEPLNVPAAPAKPSYTFANWLEVNANKRLSKTASSYIPTKNTLFKALYLYDSPATFSAVFLDDKNRIIKSFNVTRGDHITTPAAPSKSDYTFKIWLELNGPESLDDGSYTPTKNILFYALYLPSDTSTEYTTIFIDDENNAISQISVPKGDSLFPPFAPDKQNYAFVGYEEIGGSQMIPEGSTLYTPVKHALFKASYTPDSSTKYRVIFLNEDSTIAYEFNITKGDSFIIPQATDKPNHTFMGYQEVGGSKMIISGTYTPVKNITFIPLYTSDSASTYTVIFLDEENILFNGNITKGDPVAVPKAPAKADSIFKGWFEINGTQVLPNGTSSYTPTKNALFKSLYIPTSLTTYTVIFLDDNNDPTSTFNVTKGDSITVPQAPDKPNHTFIIYEEVNGTKALVSGLFTPTEDTLFKALYLPDTAAIYTTIFVDDDSNIVEEINVTKGNSLTIPNAPQKTELTFVEWREITGGLTLNSGSYIPTKNAIFKAVYTQTIYTVSFLDDSTTTNINGAFGDNITIPQASPKPNHTFMGWVNAALMLPGDMTTFTITKSTTFKALYADDTSSVYSTIFLDEEGAIIKEINVTKGDSLTAPKAPSKTDHTFLGFKEVGGDTIITSSPFTPTKNAVFKALFVSDTAAAYTTIFIDDNDNIINTINTTKGDTLAVPTASGKPHYTFTKYEEMGGSASIPSGTTTYTPVNNTVFKAIYTINIYTVTFLNDDSSYVGSFNEPYGTTITIPKPTKQDYTFLGWREAGSQLFLDKAVSSYTITKITSFKAVYSQDSSTIYTTIFLDDNNIIISEINTTKGQSLTVPKADDKPNHTFIGFKESNGTQMISSTQTSYIPNKSSVFKATYISTQATTYTTIFIDDNDDIIKEINTTKGDSLTVPTPTNKPNHTFTHYEEVGTTQTIPSGTNSYTPTKNTIFKAIYTPIIYTVTFKDDNDGIIGGSSQQVIAGHQATVPTPPNKPNYTFTHYQEVGGTITIPNTQTSYTPTKTITFKANYSPIIYKVTFQKENGEIEKEYNEITGTNIAVPQVPPKTDYTPIGWIEDGNSGSRTVITHTQTSYTVTKNITFKPYYLPNTSSNYTSLFLNDDNSLIVEINTTKGQPLAVPTAPAKQGHTFIGWMEVDGSQMIPSGIYSYTPTKNIIFKAEFSSSGATTYSVIFLDDNNDVIRKDNVTKGNSIAIPTATPKIEHTFTYYQEIGGSQTLTSGSYTPTKDITFKAIYSPIIYTVTFIDDNNAIIGSPQSGTKGQSVPVPQNPPTKPNYDFTHWQEVGGTQTIQKGTTHHTVTKTTTFKATYTPIIYTIIFLGDNNQEVNRTSASAGTSITVPQAPILPNYTFTSWIEVGGTERIPSTSSTYTVTRAVTFKAEYSPIIYTATFLNENGGFEATRTGTYGSSITVPNAPPKTGYIFTQWKEDGGTVTIPSGTNTYTLVRDITFKPEYADSFDGTHIYNQDDLNKVRNNLKGNYILMNDIALADNGAGYDGSGWLPIGDGYVNIFKGTFDGNGHKITGLWIDRGSAYYVGLFGVTEGATIKNLGVEIGSRGVKGKDQVGGIAGAFERGGTITNSYSTGSVSGDNEVGGIAGWVRSSSSITNSYFTGSVSSSNSHVGGIAGEIDSSSITNSYSTGSVSGGNDAGGIAGNVARGGTITNSYSTGSVSGGSYVGGIAGYLYSDSTITNSYSTGSVSGTGIYVGGIAGTAEQNSSITNSYSTGSISGGSNGVGGIAGHLGPRSSITNNAAINPSVSSGIYVNRIVGSIYGSGITISNNFALNTMTVTGSTGNNAGTSKTITNLKTQSTYSNPVNGDGNGGLGWKFGNNDANPWKIVSNKNNGLPYLYWENR
ncbi:MAG: InlB B-repeat-containing protein [Campylobacteraceae bacterium]|nr:InlB B-repeat-containing protein [Campylobacteraceae bacterium]